MCTQKQFDVYIVVGEQGTGKSSTIRSLINCSVQKEIECTKIINTQNGQLEIFCKSQSLQEARLDLQIPKDRNSFLQKIPISASAIAVALRTRQIKTRKAPIKIFPKAEDYIDVFANLLKWNIKYIVELSNIKTLKLQQTYNQIYYNYPPLSSNKPQSLFTSVKSLFGF